LRGKTANNSCRRASQKPPAELYENFKSRFSGLGPNVSSVEAQPAQTGATAHGEAPSEIPGYVLSHRDASLLCEAVCALRTYVLTRFRFTAAAAAAAATAAPVQPHDAKTMDPSDSHNLEPAPRPSNEPWSFGSGLTPSFMDAGNQGFSFSNQLTGYYTPTPGGTNTIFHPQAGDLHTPFHMGLGTPLSMPASEGTMHGALHAGHVAVAFNPFQPQMQHHFQPQQHHFQNMNPFQIHQMHAQPQQQTFAPHQLTHQPSFDQGRMEDSPIADMSLDMDAAQHSQHQSPELLMHPHGFHQPMPPPSYHPNAEKFRFHATLNAPTAMIKHADEIPITYLNKGQAYTLNVIDTHVHQPTTAPLKYRTFVRVSFEDEQQRQKPAACWQLWKEGRGTNEAHQRGGRLQAVEYVDSSPAAGTEDPSKPRVELESASFDGFCVTWTPPAGASECPIAVRFNFLSTDFSHSKGVKGIPVRLCAKTEIVGDPSSNTKPSPDSEVCFCKVKLFRDHGAERKLSNDVAHVKKTMDKMNQQIAQIESGMRDNSKRKRSGSFVAKAGLLDRPGKVAKHRRTWSVDSSATNAGRGGGAEDDLQMKLLTLQDMFSSTRPASVLYLRGAEEDDPDLHPVKIPGESEQVKTESTDAATWDQQSALNGDDASLVSPTPSSKSLPESRRDSTLPTPYASVSRTDSGEWRAQPQTAIGDLQIQLPQQLASPPDNPPVKVQKVSSDKPHSGWIEAIEVDHGYRPPPERAIKPVACVYVQPRISGKPSSDNYHRAVYLMSRTYKDFINAVALKCDIEPTDIIRTLRVSRNGLQVLFDDDCVRELPEGQDMIAEFEQIAESPGMDGDVWNDVDLQCDGDITTLHNIATTGYELRLLF
jgi:hypothetical protein